MGELCGNVYINMWSPDLGSTQWEVPNGKYPRSRMETAHSGGAPGTTVSIGHTWMCVVVTSFNLLPMTRGYFSLKLFEKVLALI